MVAIALSLEEQLHVENGGRVFVVEQIPGPLWRVVAVSKQGAEVLVKPDDAEGFDLQREAHQKAVAAARAEHGPVLLRESRLSYEIDFKCVNAGVAWRLRMLENHRAVAEEMFPLNHKMHDSQEAFHAAHEAALMAGESWMAARA